MSKKVTSKMLKDLIMEVMSEEKLLNEISITINPNDSWTNLKKDVGLTGLKQVPQTSGPKAAQALKDLAGQDGDGTNITDDDLKAATGNLKQTADQWYVNSSKIDRNTHSTLDAYLASLGGQGGDGGDGGGTLQLLDSAGTAFDSQFLKSGDKPHNGKIAAAIKAFLQTNPSTQAMQQVLTDLTTGFDKTDFGEAVKKQIKKINNKLGQNPPAAPATDALKAALKDIASALSTAEPENISAPPMVDVGTEQAQFPPGVITPLNDLFAGKNTYQARLQALSDISKELIVNTANIKETYKNRPRELLRDILIVDYFSTMFREIDDRAAAYYFEAFGALIGGGQVQGASNAAGDFTVAVDQGQPQTAGSSKFLSATGTSTQAVSGFIPGVDVLYLTAKKSSANQKDRVELPIEAFTIRLNKVPTYQKAGATATPNAVDFSVFPTDQQSKVKVLSATAGKAQNNVHGGQAKISVGDEYFKFEFPAGIEGENFVLHLAQNPQKIETLKELLDDEFKNATGNAEKKLQAAYQGMRDYFENLKQSQAAIRDYIGDSSNAAKAKGSKALNTLATADTKLVDTVTSLGGTITTSGTGTRTVTESKKITSNLLKKLIQEKFKK